MDWQEVEDTLAAFKTQAERVGESGPYGAADQLGRLLDFVEETPLLKDFIESCQPGMPEAQVAAHLQEVLNAMGTKSLDFGRPGEEEIARLWQMLCLLRNNIGAIRQLGYCLSLVNDGHVMIKTFGKQLVIRFYDDVALHFKQHRKEYSSRVRSVVQQGGGGRTDGTAGQIATPRVFISYAQDGHPDQVRTIVDQLITDGVDVIFDEYDLRLGHDVNKFMELTVNDPVMSKVLIMCDRVFMEKANARKGGVGKETTIISEEVYSRTAEGKFIPVILEYDENGAAYRPTFIKSANFIDLSKDGPAGENYEHLLHEIYGKPWKKKPALGKPTSFLFDEETDAHPDLSRVLRTIQLTSGGAARKKQHYQDFYRPLARALEGLWRGKTGPNSARTLMRLTLPIRDICLKIHQVALEDNAIAADDIADLLEKLHKELCPLQGGGSYANDDLAYLDSFFHEMFICLTSLLLDREDYGGLHNFLWRTYFLRSTWFEIAQDEPCQYTIFRKACPARSQDWPPTVSFRADDSNRTGLFEARELLPHWTSRKIQRADLFLFQMSEFKNREDESPSGIWYPVTATHYGDVPQVGWSRLFSKRYCLRMFPLFGVTTIDELKSELYKMDVAIKRNHWDTQTPGWVLGNIPGITNEIHIEKIGSMD